MSGRMSEQMSGPMSGLAVAEGDGCWRRIGVSGDRSCAELARHIHCRNCSAYTDAAQRNLRRPVEPGYRETWAQQLARPEAALPVTDAAAMVFRIGADWLAVPFALVASVAPLAPVHRLPHRSDSTLLGIVNVDGKLVAAVSLAGLLGIAPGAAPDAGHTGRRAFARLLVLAFRGHTFALPVDEVQGLARHVQASLRAPAATVRLAPGTLVSAVLAADGIEAGLLDADLLQTRLEGLLR
jgi:chemotaxis-related protein WspD